MNMDIESIFPIIAQSARLDWFDYGVASINRTGAFIACAIMACWALAAIPKKAFFWVALACSAVLMCFLIQTQSRGAFVSLAVSFCAFLLLSKLRISKTRAAALALFCVAAVLYSTHVGFSKRMTSMVTLQSSAANCRAEIYLSGLKMLTDAPNGFNDVESPVEMYHRWYQALDNGHRFLDMINSHLEFMCKHNVPLKLAYVFLWTLALCISFPRRGDIFCAAAFSTLLCFFCTAIFTHTENFWVLWIIPLAMLAGAAAVNRRRFAEAGFWAAELAVFSAAVLALCAVSALLPRDAKLKFTENAVYVGNAEGGKRFLIFCPNPKVLGSKYGKELALFLGNAGGYATVSDKYDGREYSTIAFSGEYDRKRIPDMLAEKFLFLNAPPPNEEDSKKLPSGKIEAVLGDISDWRNKMRWRETAEDNPAIDLKILPGVADYVPEWTRLLDSGKKSPD